METCPESVTRNIEPTYRPIVPSYVSHGVPVFEPTWDEFQDFIECMGRIEFAAASAGICKIIPPKEWSRRMPKYGNMLKEKSTISGEALPSKEEGT